MNDSTFRFSRHFKGAEGEGEIVSRQYVAMGVGTLCHKTQLKFNSRKLRMSLPYDDTVEEVSTNENNYRKIRSRK